jgi:imidazolonepropionase
MPVLANIGQLATCPPDRPQADAGLIPAAAVAWTGDRIEWTGLADTLPERFREEPVVDAGGRLVVPGLVDCHTHLCFGGWRGDEFDQRLRGRSYSEIAEAGGGITSTVRATRAAPAGDLVEKARKALDGMLALGVTAVECKSGYGLDKVNEIKQLEVYRQLDATHAVDLFPTFLGAHIVPPEFADDREGYVRLLCDDLIPEIARRKLALFCDAFVEEGAYSAEEAGRVFNSAVQAGLQIKLHADQLSAGGGAELAAAMSAVSAEHLEHVSEAGIRALAGSGTIAVSLPLASLYLGEPYMPARELIEAGVPVAVATDFNPGSAPSWHLPLAMTLACLNQRMTPQEVLNGATTIAARAVAAHDRIGSLLPGYQADLAIIDAPTLNQWLYHFTPNACQAVLKRGKWVIGDVRPTER